MRFESGTFQRNTSHVDFWEIEASNNLLAIGSFTCSVSSAQQFAPNYQILACPLPERNSTCGEKLDLFNSTVLAGTLLTALFAKWAFGVQLECWALNPYRQTIFPRVRSSIWRLTAIAVTTTPGHPDTSPHFFLLALFTTFLIFY